MIKKLINQPYAPKVGANSQSGNKEEEERRRRRTLTN
jgi:hypothetical protein